MKRFLSILLAIVLCAAIMIAGMLSGYAEEPESGSNSVASCNVSSESAEENSSSKRPNKMPEPKGDNT